MKFKVNPQLRRHCKVWELSTERLPVYPGRPTELDSEKQSSTMEVTSLSTCLYISFTLLYLQMQLLCYGKEHGKTVRNKSRVGKKVTRRPSESRAGRSHLLPGIVQSCAQSLSGPISVDPPSGLEGQGGHYCPPWCLMEGGWIQWFLKQGVWFPSIMIRAPGTLLALNTVVECWVTQRAGQV